MKNQPERLLERAGILADYVTPAERIGDECYLRTQRSRAIAWLDVEKGGLWRGRSSCRHVYTNRDGERIDLNRETMMKD